MIEVAPSGYAVLLRAGAVVLFGVDPIQQERFIADLGARIHGPLPAASRPSARPCASATPTASIPTR